MFICSFSDSANAVKAAAVLSFDLFIGGENLIIDLSI